MQIYPHIGDYFQDPISSMCYVLAFVIFFLSTALLWRVQNIGEGDLQPVTNRDMASRAAWAT
jgi:hypothetical protein